MRVTRPFVIGFDLHQRDGKACSLMKRISRRRVLSTFAAAGAASLLTGCRDANLPPSVIAADAPQPARGLLNRDLDGNWIERELTPEVNSCVDCHSKKGQGDAMVRMNCATCHQFESKHP
jgi:hypothetical protein